MSHYFTQDWFYRTLLNPDCVVRCFFGGVAVSAKVDSTPELRQFLNSDANCLRVRMEADIFDSSCGAVLFDGAGETLRAFDAEDKAAARSALAQFIRERYGMGVASYWHRNLNRDIPGYRPLNDRETALIRRRLSNPVRNAWAFRSSREALETLDSLALKMTDDLEKETGNGPDALDWLNCIVELKRGVLYYGLPTLSEENMFYGMEISQLGLALNLYHIQISYDSPPWGIPARNGTPEPVLRRRRSTLFISEMPYLSCGEYARRNGVSESDVHEWIRRGEIRMACRDGEEWKVPADFPLPDGAFSTQTYFLTGEPVPEKAMEDYPLLFHLSSGQSFQICENESREYAVFPLPRAKSNGAARPVAVFSREERERFEFYLLRSDWVTYEVPKYMIPVREGLRTAEN